MRNNLDWNPITPDFRGSTELMKLGTQGIAAGGEQLSKVGDTFTKIGNVIQAREDKEIAKKKEELSGLANMLNNEAYSNSFVDSINPYTKTAVKQFDSNLYNSNLHTLAKSIADKKGYNDSDVNFLLSSIDTTNTLYKGQQLNQGIDNTILQYAKLDQDNKQYNYNINRNTIADKEKKLEQEANRAFAIVTQGTPEQRQVLLSEAQSILKDSKATSKDKANASALLRLNDEISKNPNATMADAKGKAYIASVTGTVPDKTILNSYIEEEKRLKTEGSGINNARNTLLSNAQKFIQKSADNPKASILPEHLEILGTTFDALHEAYPSIDPNHIANMLSNQMSYENNWGSNEEYIRNIDEYRNLIQNPHNLNNKLLMSLLPVKEKKELEEQNRKKNPLSLNNLIQRNK